jgi:hypothetical protein
MPASALAEAVPSESDWYANVIWLDRRKCLLAVHAGTLFPVFAADVRKRDLSPPGPLLVALVRGALAEEGFPADVLGPLDPGLVRVARTERRSVLGYMNEMAFVCRYSLDSVGSLDDLDLGALNRLLRRELHNRGGDYQRPVDLMSQLLARAHG